MIDKTTQGLAASPAEVEGMLRNLCAYALSEPEPLQRYLDLTHQQVAFDGVVSAIRRERGRALADMLASGLPVDKVAQMAKLDTPTSVKTLVVAAGRTMPRAKGKAPAGKPSATKATTAKVAAPEAAPVNAAAAKAAKAPARSGVPMLPLPAAPTGKRMLTAEERRALGLVPPAHSGKPASIGQPAPHGKMVPPGQAASAGTPVTVGRPVRPGRPVPPGQASSGGGPVRPGRPVPPGQASSGGGPVPPGKPVPPQARPVTPAPAGKPAAASGKQLAGPVTHAPAPARQAAPSAPAQPPARSLRRLLVRR